MKVHWKLKEWDAITRDELYAFSTLRAKVFVVEQDCPYLDFDDKDQKSLHLWASLLEGADAEKVVAYLRMPAPGVSYEEVSIGRVVVDQAFRGEQLGKELMQRGMQAIEERYGRVAVRISAQEYLRSFYESLGFQGVGEGYLEDGIPHLEMSYQP